MKPILFNTEMVKAILDGRKTTTRRVIKPQPINGIMTAAGLLKAIPEHMDWGGKVIKPTYQKDDVLYVRETFGTYRACDIISYAFKADYIDPKNLEKAKLLVRRWHPSIHMPKEAARIFLRVTDVKAERLQDITDNEAKAEGTDSDVQIAGGYVNPNYYRSRFSWHVWDSTIKKSNLNRYGWDANPWVWVISFERTARPDEK